MNGSEYRRPRDVGVVDGDSVAGGAPGTVYLAHLPNGPLIVLEGSAALIWRTSLATANHSGRSVAVRVAEAMGSDPAAIQADVEAFLRELVTKGLLEMAPCSDGPPHSTG